MRKAGWITGFAWTLWTVFAGPLWAEWQSLSQNLPETDVRTMAVDPKNPKTIYAGSQRRLYKSADGGASWKQILGVRGTDNEVKFIYLDPEEPQHIYAATSHGIKRSLEGGKNWNEFYQGIGGASKAVFCIASSPQNPKTLWVGTGAGLVTLDIDGKDPKAINGVPKAAVHSILMNPKASGMILVGTEKGIYKSKDGGEHWERRSANLPSTGTSDPDGEETKLDQFNVEEILTAPFSYQLIYVESQDKFYSVTQNGIFESRSAAEDWTALKSRGLPDKKINFLASSSQTFYVATDRGIFQWDQAGGTLKDVSAGLESLEVGALFYDAPTDRLFAGTKRGFYQFSHPEFESRNLSTNSGEKDQATVLTQTKDILKLFGSEPSIREIQNAAIQYAEVHPDKIQEWRQAAARKAWFPTVSVNRSRSVDQNIDLDRGGTNDPDKFITGPSEDSDDWSVGVSWNLGELVWNDDQTSIDTRSRLMVELRDDVLTEVTHLYYERRRLQVEMAMSPAVDTALRIEKELRLEELTAAVDALTGAYLSRHLMPAEKGEIFD